MAMIAALAVLTVAACAFTVAPLWGRWTPSSALLCACISICVIGTAWGAYYLVGSPRLALRAANPDSAHEPNAEIPGLIARVRNAPKDEAAWTKLGDLYMQADQPVQAAAAYRKAISAIGNGQASVPLVTSLAEALVATDGKVSDEALQLFQIVYARNSFNPAARYFMGQAYVERGDVEGGMAYWRSLLADTPPSSPLYTMLNNRIADLSQLTNDPDAPAKMVEGLAAKLRVQPHDLAGWERLIRSYVILGQGDRAKEALGNARREFSNDHRGLAELEQEVHQLNIE